MPARIVNTMTIGTRIAVVVLKKNQNLTQPNFVFDSKENSTKPLFFQFLEC